MDVLQLAIPSESYIRIWSLCIVLVLELEDVRGKRRDGSCLYRNNIKINFEADFIRCDKAELNELV
jgi:hypothetical protein